MVTIRRANLSDAGVISGLSRQLGYSISETATEARIREIFASDRDEAYVALIGGAVVAWMHMSYVVKLERSSYCEISGLIVDESFRGKGVGQELLEYAKGWCRDRGCNTLLVRSNVVRHRAHEFYLRSGFKECKEQKVLEASLLPS